MNNSMEQARQRALKMLETRWVRWVHELIPKQHCVFCLNLGDCCFTIDKCPTLPLHPNYHCYTKEIGGITATAACAIKKWEYVFSFRGISDKSKLFAKLGYSINNIDYLLNEFTKQGEYHYEAGEYELRELKPFGLKLPYRIR